ncbi:type VII secretion EssA family protein [Edaphobacillus lindanitolerans]|uniref:Type VII secretion protein EssA n=1 Tax=Edaphobacillus lindanitolerans TaxID=550447 RepID=A0A1U7PM51_9BACI|nr:hypothetical protein SAMN05428946_0636 [Edaphobacillus lindanitolerans]
MKCKFVPALILAVCACSVPDCVAAAEDNPAEDLESLKYDSLKFDQNTEYLHDRGHLEMKNTLSEAQVKLDFSEQIRFPSPIDPSALFNEPGRASAGTAAAVASEMGLFSEDRPTASVRPENNAGPPAESSGGTTFRTWAFVGIILLSVAGLFALMLPALLRSGRGSKA